MRRLFVLVALAIAGSVQAQPVLKDYPKLKAQPCFKMYIDGLGTGIREANVALLVRNQARLYCPPPKLAMHSENYIDILEREINAGITGITRPAPLPPVPYPEDTPIETILLQGLQKTFPCKQ